MQEEIAGAGKYEWGSAAPSYSCAYLESPVLELCEKLSAKRVLDLGCGNGAFTKALVERGFETVGCDPDEDGLVFARENAPNAKFIKLGVYDDPAGLGEKDFDVVVSTEVVEHLYSPSALPRFAAQVLAPGGHLIVSTPYHGYLKNVLISLAGKWDFHHHPLDDGGHIKFWSKDTLTALLKEQGFRVKEFMGAGRLPYIWKSMILLAQR